MRCIYNHSNDPYFNLATEEYLLKEYTQDIFMLWRNGPSIIVGKHQNTLSEINYDYVREKNIKVVRRLSGGGTVFHDLGNLNFTFIQNGRKENLVDFRKFTKPILEFLAQIGVEAKFEGRNDLTIDGKKFSGNAEHVHKDRILHHGTLLFSSEMADLTAALNVSPAKFTDKSVKSVRSRVTNISEHLPHPMGIEAFTESLMDFVTSTREDSQAYELSEKDKTEINKLVASRYGTWEWNFGYSPKYNFNRSFKSSGGHLDIYLEVKDGIIGACKIYGDFFHILEVEELEQALHGLPHEFDAIMNKLKNMPVQRYIQGVSNEEFVQGLF